MTLLAQRTGCQLLLDVNNIYVNALNARINDLTGDPVQHCPRWPDAVNPDDVGEIHLAGHCHVKDADGEVVMDDQGSRICPGVWQMYQHAVTRFGPVPTLIEWDTDVPALDVLLEEAARARYRRRCPGRLRQPGPADPVRPGRRALAAGERLRLRTGTGTGTGEVALMWRAGWRMLVHRPLDVAAWLPMAIQTGLVLGASSHHL